MTNYVTSLRAGLFNVAAAAGVDTPVKIERKHLVYKDDQGRISSVDSMLQQIQRLKRKVRMDSLPDK